MFPEMCSILPDDQEGTERRGSPTNLPEEGDVFPELCSILPDVFTPTCNGTSSGNSVAGKSMAACSPVDTQSIPSNSGTEEDVGSEGWGVNTI